MHRACLLLTLLLAASCGDVSSADPDGGSPTGDGGTNPDATPTDPVQVCEPAPPTPDSGLCDVAEGTGSAVLIRGTVLGAGTVFEGGAVVYEGDSIACVGCDCADDPTWDDATRIECGTAVVSPALLNPHDHLSFTEGAPIDHGTTRYDHRHDWRGSLSTPSNPNGTGDDSAGMRWGELRMVMAGATTLVGSGRASGMMRNLDALESPEYDRGFERAEFETFPLGDGGEDYHADCGWNYKASEIEVANLPSYLPHIAEGIDSLAAEEFYCQSRSDGDARDFTERNTAHIHSIGLDAADYFRMAHDGAQIIWSPRSNISLYGHTAQVSTFHRLGGVLALGTDWTYSGSANMLRELACADRYNRDYLDGYFTDEALWRMATIGAARVTASDELIGSLEVGKLADVAVFAADAGEHHRAVLEAGNADVALVVKAGLPLYGEADVVAGLGDSCEAIDVCGASRAVCAEREFGTAYDAIATEVSGSYPAIFCDGAPADEPTCVPSRPGEFSGELTSGDADGDGIADDTDNCPAVFNPPRPIDDGSQPDADGDGTGDPCDPTPVPSDIDGDGVDNDADNCPLVANDGQADGDGDDKGDACDPCPDIANPDGVCPPAAVSITSIQNGDVATGSAVTVTGAVVTGVRDNAAAIQDPDAPEAAWSGIYVFTGSPPGVAIGDEVTVVGTVEEYFDVTEIGDATITRTGTATPIAPTQVTVADAATEAYEGVLVTLTDAGTIVDPYDCSADHPDCGDANLWEIDGAIIVWDNLYQDGDWSAQSGTTPVTGVMHYRFERRRLMPRVSGDFGD